ncbi:MAG: penicillin-binding protein activator LpoB [Smithellaceae bacterium]
MKIRFSLFLLIILISFVAGCGPTIRYEIKDEETVTGSDWSAKDLKDVSDYMAASIKKSAFISSSQYISEKPRWMLARDMKNETDEHVNTRTIMEKIRTRLINGGIANFIDDQAIEDILNQMKLQQSGLFDNKTVAQVGKLVGARMILRGAISSIRKKTDRQDIIYYNVTLQLVNIQTGEIIWTDEKEIQRLTSKSMFR